MPIDSISEEPRPELGRSVSSELDRRGLLGDETDDSLGDGIEVVIVRRALRLVQQELATERVEHL